MPVASSQDRQAVNSGRRVTRASSGACTRDHSAASAAARAARSGTSPTRRRTAAARPSGAAPLVRSIVSISSSETVREVPAPARRPSSRSAARR